MTSITTAYDALPYESLPLAQTHPDHLSALATLLGLTPPRLETCRVLEIGCAAGGNLIPIALSLPGASCVGIDLSAVQVAQGRKLIEQLGAGNVSLRQLDIMDADESLGRFDFIIAHGVFSWVPERVQERLLDLTRRLLNPDGIAYVSYNTLPGWYTRSIVRDLMRFHAMGFSDLGARIEQARAVVELYAQRLPFDNQVFRSEIEQLRGQADHYVLHEYLAEENNALYFVELVRRAAQHGLQYLTEAEFVTTLPAALGSAVAAMVQEIAPEPIRQQQLLDFLRHRAFRQSLLVHDTAKVQRELRASRIRGLRFAGALQAASERPDLSGPGVERFQARSGAVVNTPAPLTKAALAVLGERFPESLSLEELREAARLRLGSSATSARDAEALGVDLLHTFLAGAVELHSLPPRFTMRPGERPTASALARLQAATGAPLTNLRHEALRLDAALTGLLPLLDGTRDRRSLLGARSALHGEAGLDAALRQLASEALLEA
jgi:SAM-dependent methyltransferase